MRFLLVLPHTFSNMVCLGLGEEAGCHYEQAIPKNQVNMKKDNNEGNDGQKSKRHREMPAWQKSVRPSQ